MRRILPLIIATIAVVTASLVSAQTVATDPVGFLTLTVYGPASTGGTANTYIGLSFTQPVSYQATLASASGTTLTDSNATWGDNAYNGANGNYYVELTTGSGTGRMSQITATSGTNKTITTANDLSSFVTAGTGYKIRPNWTLAGIFGPNDQSGLAGGVATTADQILVYSNSGQSYTTYYYKTGGITGGTGWRSTASLSQDASNAFFLPTDGLLVIRHTAGNVTFALAGAVKLGQTQLPVATGTNILSNVYPSGNLTLGSSNLYTGNSSTGLTGGIITTADQVLIYNNTTNGFDTYYYKTGGITGGTGWRSTASLSNPADSTPIPFGASIIIQKNNAGSFTWVVGQPF